MAETATETIERLSAALAWYANWEDNITNGIHDHGTEDGESVPDMGRRAHDALLGMDVTAEGYEESIEASQLARWGDSPTEEPHDPYVRGT